MPHSELTVGYFPDIVATMQNAGVDDLQRPHRAIVEGAMSLGRGRCQVDHESLEATSDRDLHPGLD
ncbi:hypothetical protein FYZ48_23065 [Gimesia chilikensis]|uniref:hypothetical protein n=1 Tax=Gimesia chilikensis TaxID=2605989 RepID=UPI0011EC5CA2|nr:hypothetical protein [Gimesia chilikensis]KAA0133696.1 hypothetical protein FYZ48_23065 [Gimesia chilikensis]